MAKKLAPLFARKLLSAMVDAQLSPGDVVRVLRPRELTYLCEICDELRTLRICDDVFYEDEEDEEDAEESD